MNLAQSRRLPALADVKRLYVEERLSSTMIAAQYGCHPQSIRYMLKGSGVAIRNKQEAALLSYTEWTEERIALLQELWPTGMPIPEIHRRLGISYGLKSVSMKAKAIGLPRRENPVKAKKPEPKPVPQTTRRTVGEFRDRTIISFLPESPRLEMAWRHELAKVRQERGARWTEILGVER